MGNVVRAVTADCEALIRIVCSRRRAPAPYFLDRKIAKMKRA